MPLDRIKGELVQGLDAPYVVIEPRLLAMMTRYLTAYTVKGKFGTTERTRPVFDDAVAHAIEAFADAGALRPIRFDEDDVLVQVYPSLHVVAVRFQRAICGKDHYVTLEYPLPPPVMDALLAETTKKRVLH